MSFKLLLELLYLSPLIKASNLFYITETKTWRFSHVRWCEISCFYQPALVPIRIEYR